MRDPVALSPSPRPAQHASLLRSRRLDRPVREGRPRPPFRRAGIVLVLLRLPGGPPPRGLLCVHARQRSAVLFRDRQTDRTCSYTAEPTHVAPAGPAASPTNNETERPITRERWDTLGYQTSVFLRFGFQKMSFD